MRLYLCDACASGDHAHCEIGHSVPPGVCGGSRCSCSHESHHFVTTPAPNEAEKEDDERGISEWSREEILKSLRDLQAENARLTSKLAEMEALLVEARNWGVKSRGFDAEKCRQTREAIDNALGTKS